MLNQDKFFIHKSARRVKAANWRCLHTIKTRPIFAALLGCIALGCLLSFRGTSFRSSSLHANQSQQRSGLEEIPESKPARKEGNVADHRLLIATHNRLFWFNYKTGQAKLLHDGEGVHYGVFPGDGDGTDLSVWVVIRPHNFHPKTSREYLVELNAQTGREVRRVQIDSRFTHDAVRTGKSVYVCSTATGQILQYSMPNMTLVQKMNIFTKKDHVNTLAPLSKNELWVMLHKKGPSDVVRLDLSVKPPKVKSRWSNVGIKAHGLVMWRGRLVSLDSTNAAVITMDHEGNVDVVWKADDEQLFLKGLAVVDDVAFFGMGVGIDRAARNSPDHQCTLGALDLMTGQLLWRRELPTNGLLNVISAPHLGESSTYRAKFVDKQGWNDEPHKPLEEPPPLTWESTESTSQGKDDSTDEEGKNHANQADARQRLEDNLDTFDNDGQHSMQGTDSLGVDNEVTVHAGWAQGSDGDEGPHVLDGDGMSHGFADGDSLHGSAARTVSHETIDAGASDGPADSGASHGAADSSASHGAADSGASHGTTDSDTSHGTDDGGTSHAAADSGAAHVVDAVGSQGMNAQLAKKLRHETQARADNILISTHKTAVQGSERKSKIEEGQPTSDKQQHTWTRNSEMQNGNSDKNGHGLGGSSTDNGSKSAAGPSWYLEGTQKLARALQWSYNESGFPPKKKGAWFSGMPRLDNSIKGSARMWEAGLMLPLMEVDVSAIKARLSKVGEKIWDPNEQAVHNAVVGGRDGNLDKFKPGVESIVLMFSDQSGANAYQYPYYDTFKAVLEPILYKVLRDDMRNIIRLQFARMKPGVMIKLHHDMGLYAKRGHRIHIPIQINPGVRFDVCPKADQLAEKQGRGAVSRAAEKPGMCIPIVEGEGLAFELNNRVLHRVFNNGSTNRVQLIVDVAEHPPLRRGLKQGSGCEYTRGVVLCEDDALVTLAKSQ